MQTNEKNIVSNDLHTTHAMWRCLGIFGTVSVTENAAKVCRCVWMRIIKTRLRVCVRQSDSDEPQFQTECKLMRTRRRRRRTPRPVARLLSSSF